MTSETEGMEAMRRMKELAKRAAHVVSCWMLDAAWLCWGAWRASAEEMRDQAGYEGGTR